ncbi:MAG: hypothetical protein A2Z21_08395 [Candidatus Fraserbacteria bacterium RBG_16_55_9]|uniref:Uncharacterized protein n=1 Tax=Fraserbacteria sp. (strain RBG_16_55_9) TaxID=1817864 RepID=A0A1F5USJ4_FRAXR|nr:MAG: hypothetical protein A2Z21_08395 [Candidatus Fraserbacteria bacterium RBG_16_55_9]
MAIKNAIDGVLRSRGYAALGSPLEDASGALYTEGTLGLGLLVSKQSGEISGSWDALFSAPPDLVYDVFVAAWSVFSSSSQKFKDALRICLNTGESKTFTEEMFVAELNCRIRTGILEIFFRKRSLSN